MAERFVLILRGERPSLALAPAPEVMALAVPFSCSWISLSGVSPSCSGMKAKKDSTKACLFTSEEGSSAATAPLEVKGCRMTA